MDMEKMIKTEDVVIRPYLTEEGFTDFQDFLESKAAALFRHELEDKRMKIREMEEKNGFWGRYSSANSFYFDIDNDNVRVCLAADNIFLSMIKEQYLNAFDNYKDNFGTGDALDVLKALYLNSGFRETRYCFLRYIDVALAYETCCYAFFKRGNAFDDEFLRIDLFREIKPNKDNPDKLEFIGGLFHALKHFSYQGRNLSIGCEVEHTEVDSLMEVVKRCIIAFLHKQKEEKGKDYVYDESINNGKQLRYVFYKEENTGTYYIKSVHLK